MKFGIVCKYTYPLIVEEVKKVLKIIKSKGHEFEVEKELGKLIKIKGVPIEKMTSNMILSIGESPTILRTFKELGENKIPVLAISYGTAGFLAETEFKNFENDIKKIEKKGYFIENRSRLTVEINGKKLPYALNDVVIASKKGATIIRYALKVGKELIWRDVADGVIVSTPTGSTGYALSSGGPIISNSSNVFLIVPICSINQNKPFVVDDKNTIEIGGTSSYANCEVIIDGNYRFELGESTVKIKKSDFPAMFVRFESDVHSRVFHKLGIKFETSTSLSRDAPPSAKFIHKILQYEGPLTQKELIKASMLPGRTVRSSIKYLIKNGLIIRQTSLRDTRQSVFIVCES
jgi:NAD+ kinase